MRGLMSRAKGQSRRQVSSCDGEHLLFYIDTAAAAGRQGQAQFHFLTPFLCALCPVKQVQYCFTAEGQPDSRNPSSLLGLDGDLYYRCAVSSLAVWCACPDTRHDLLHIAERSADGKHE